MDKKKLIKEYLNDLTYPSPDSEIGLNKYNSWDGEKILERSLVIINTLYAKLLKTKVGINLINLIKALICCRYV